MKRLLPVVMGFALLLLSSTEGWSLPVCPDTPTSRWSTARYWTDCFGTETFANGGKYVGEFKDSNFHGQGIKIYADGTVMEGIWENNKFFSAKKPRPKSLPTLHLQPNPR
jgi:hypothetical protein